MNELLGINHIVDSIERTMKTSSDNVSDSYKYTVTRGSDIFLHAEDIAYVELNNFFQIADDLRENISTIASLVLILIGAGCFVSVILLGDKVILVLQSLPRLFDSLSLVKL